jgi:hypothetical protein
MTRSSEEILSELNSLLLTAPLTEEERAKGLALLEELLVQQYRELEDEQKSRRLETRT